MRRLGHCQPTNLRQSLPKCRLAGSKSPCRNLRAAAVCWASPWAFFGRTCQAKLFGYAATSMHESVPVCTAIGNDVGAVIVWLLPASDEWFPTIAAIGTALPRSLPRRCRTILARWHQRDESTPDGAIGGYLAGRYHRFTESKDLKFKLRLGKRPSCYGSSASAWLGYRVEACQATALTSTTMSGCGSPRTMTVVRAGPLLSKYSP